MKLSHHKKHYLGLLQNAYLEMDHELYQAQVKEIKERAKQQGIDSQVFDQWVDEIQQKIQQCPSRKIS